VFSLDELESLQGRRFPGGSFLIAGYEDFLMRHVVGAPARRGSTAHPIWMFAAPQTAMGISIDELFSWCGSSATAGVMLGETRLSMLRPLRIEQRYTVTGGIDAVERKQGRRAGIFDVVRFHLELSDAQGPSGEVRTSFVYPRRD
jgi:hypothetical protein